jgi:hypothetical protein
MENERGIRVPERLKDKIKLAATVNKMSMVDYLDSVVPNFTVDEKKCDQVSRDARNAEYAKVNMMQQV